MILGAKVLWLLTSFSLCGVRGMLVRRVHLQRQREKTSQKSDVVVKLFHLSQECFHSEGDLQPEVKPFAGPNSHLRGGDTGKLKNETWELGLRTKGPSGVAGEP